MKKLSQQVAEKSGNGEWLKFFQKLSGSAMNTLLLELFRSRVERTSPSDVLKQFEQNRFTSPSGIPVLDFKEFELRWLKFAESRNFVPVTLSPLTPLGTSSVFGKVDQNNVVSGVRGVEVVSDATNVLALLIAQRYKKEKSALPYKYAATHRQVRAQAFTNPGFSAHFGVLCLATGGLDTGSFSFERESLVDHLNTHLQLLGEEFGKSNLQVKLFIPEREEQFISVVKESIRSFETSRPVDIEPSRGKYYGLLQFKIFLHFKNNVMDLSDGGVVDWTQQLTANRKHRLFISGSGTELAYKILKGLL